MNDIDEGPTKYELLEELKKSGMHPSDRLIMLYLIDLAELHGDGEVWFIPEYRSPSHTELTTWTGLGRSTVKACLTRLEGNGWIKRSAPATADALGRGEKTDYRLCKGVRVERDKVSRPANPTRKAAPAEAPRPAVGPVQPLAEGRPEENLGQPLAGGRPAVGSPLGQPLADPRPAVGHINHPPTEGGSTQDSQPDPHAHAAAAATAPALPGLEPDEDAPPPKRKRAKKAAAPRPPTEGQRINTLARRYTDVVKLAPFHGVRAAVQAAVRCGDYTDEQIAAALDHLALPDNRDRLAVTANSLRIAIATTSGRAAAPSGRPAFQNPTDTAAYREDL